jgi:hypothetical protein
MQQRCQLSVSSIYQLSAASVSSAVAGWLQQAAAATAACTVMLLEQQQQQPLTLQGCQQLQIAATTQLNCGIASM